jgi:genome maintenance exonuclease 1
MLKTYKPKHVWIDGKRYHQWGDKVYPGVTTILSGTKDARDSQALDKWRSSVGEDEAKEITRLACDRGTEVHACIEDHLVGIERKCDPQWRGFWDSIRPALVNVSNVQLIEGALWHPRGFAGSVDCVGEWEGEMSIIDWKTSTKPKKAQWIDDYKLQTAAYCAAVNRLYAKDGLKIKRAAIVIALGDRPAQVFKVEPNEIMGYWKRFGEKVDLYHQKFPVVRAS